MTIKTVRDAVFALLRDTGMTTVFGNPGSTELPFIAPWPSDLRYVLALQEASVVAMADGFAQARGAAAFVNLHSAAGVGNGLGSLYTAFRNQSPLVITAGQQARSLLASDPYLGAERAAEFPAPYVKWSTEPLRAEDVPPAIAQAYAIAMERPRGPTFVSIPSDDWNRPADPVRRPRQAWDTAPEPQSIAALADALKTSRRPVLVVGAEVDRQGAYELAVVLAERLGAPVWEAPNSSRSSFPQHHRLFAGFLPAIPERLSDKLLEHDLIVVIGAPVFSFHVPGAAAILESGPPIVHITDNPFLAARSRATTTILSAMVPALQALLAQVKEIPRDAPGARLQVDTATAADPISPAYAVQEIARVLPRDAVVVEEAPSHRPAIQRHLPIVRPRSFYTMASGGLGWAMPAAVGIALAERRPVLCLVGDGSAMYSIQALWTAAQEKLPVVFAVLNNKGYGALRSFSQLLQTGAPPGIDLPGLSFADIARGMGAAAIDVARAADIQPAIERAFAEAGPVLVDIPVDPDAGDIY